MIRRTLTTVERNTRPVYDDIVICLDSVAWHAHNPNVGVNARCSDLAGVEREKA